MKKPTIYYVYDAYCGWCYGQSASMREVYEALKEDYCFHVYSGGMIRGARVGSMASMANYILEAIPRLEEMTGTKVGNAYKTALREDSIHADSLPPAIALTAFNHLSDGDNLYFAGDIQKLLFEEAKDLNDMSNYTALAVKHGLDAEKFEEVIADEQTRKYAQEDFAIVESWGVNSFPSVVLEYKDELFLVAQGYRDKESIIKTIDKIVQAES
ncbi:MAG: DsbA family protein [Cyclobacteriaceae bacterium]|nr:DsbA family protein [Cyclobacteriaceae bacterium]MCH8517523.1 DsbA family protein [Cyclobacteriaceae bacterium]